MGRKRTPSLARHHQNPKVPITGTRAPTDSATIDRTFAAEYARPASQQPTRRASSPEPNQRNATRGSGIGATGPGSTWEAAIRITMMKEPTATSTSERFATELLVTSAPLYIFSFGGIGFISMVRSGSETDLSLSPQLVDAASATRTQQLPDRGLLL